LDVVGERWALLIVRELLYGPKRFTDVRSALEASPNVLSQRLGELEEGGVVQRRSAGGALYELTDWARELHPILLQLGRWGARSAQRPVGSLSVDALMAALEATFTPENAQQRSALYELRLGEERYAAHVSGASLTITRGSPRRPDAIIETDPATLRALAFGDQKLAGAPIEIEGDMRLGKSFFKLFKRP
jgi:DNA-binding HxlR family transcriptional regulator